MNPEQFQKHCELQALWWISYANTGACKNRNITRADVQLTDDEKVEDALNTAQNHIRLFRESCERV
jgi:hypothetical protein